MSWVLSMVRRVLHFREFFFAKLRAFFTKICILQICNKIKVTFFSVLDFFTNNLNCQYFYCFVSKHSGEILQMQKYEKCFEKKKIEICPKFCKIPSELKFLC